MTETIAAVATFIVMAVVTIGMLCLFISIIIGGVQEYMRRKRFDAEYWPRDVQIEAQRQYRDIPARLDQWRKERGE